MADEPYSPRFGSPSAEQSLFGECRHGSGQRPDCPAKEQQQGKPYRGGTAFHQKREASQRCDVQHLPAEHVTNRAYRVEAGYRPIRQACHPVPPQWRSGGHCHGYGQNPAGRFGKAVRSVIISKAYPHTETARSYSPGSFRRRTDRTESPVFCECTDRRKAHDNGTRSNECIATGAAP